MRSQLEHPENGVTFLPCVARFPKGFTGFFSRKPFSPFVVVVVAGVIIIVVIADVVFLVVSRTVRRRGERASSAAITRVPRKYAITGCRSVGSLN